jgi:hypothetical protein
MIADEIAREHDHQTLARRRRGSRKGRVHAIMLAP